MLYSFNRIIIRPFSQVTKSCVNCDNFISSTRKCAFYKSGHHVVDGPTYEYALVARQDSKMCGHDAINFKHRYHSGDDLIDILFRLTEAVAACGALAIMAGVAIGMTYLLKS